MYHTFLFLEDFNLRALPLLAGKKWLSPATSDKGSRPCPNPASPPSPPTTSNRRRPDRTAAAEPPPSSSLTSAVPPATSPRRSAGPAGSGGRSRSSATASRRMRGAGLAFFGSPGEERLRYACDAGGMASEGYGIRNAGEGGWGLELEGLL